MSTFVRQSRNVLPRALSFSVRTGAVICIGTLLLSADTLTLRNGSTVQGTYLGGTARQIRMEQNGDIRNYDVSEVQSVIFSDSGYQPAPPPPPPANSSSYPSRDRDRRDVADNRDSNRSRSPQSTSPQSTAL